MVRLLSAGLCKGQMIKMMNDESGIIVCKEDNYIHGYLCTSLPEFNMTFELQAAMIALFATHRYKEKYLNQYRYVIAGPWCIQREARGRNLFVNMWNTLNKILPKQTELIVTFISVNNPRSLHAAKKVN